MNRTELLSFRASGALWAIPIAEVLEILESPPLIRLPLLPDSAPGIIGVRGSAIPAFDVGRIIGDGHASGRSAIIAAIDHRRIALMVDTIEDIVDEAETDATMIDVATLVATLNAEGRVA